jgi:N-acetylglutamate synthase-like GNAT family acetyltransferase
MTVIYKYLDCGDLHLGFDRVRCEECGHEYLLAFSCKRRQFCSSCHQKRVAEIACLAVHANYQRAGLGDRLLQIAEDRALKSGMTKLYTLTTQSSHWFLEHGFTESTDSCLPAAKRASYNPQRASKILLKSI